MLIASNRGLGMSLHVPDVCKLPPMGIPAPLPNMGLNAQSLPFSPNIQICMVPATNMGTKKMMTLGDEPGVMGGLLTGAIKGPGSTVVGNFIVFINGLPAENLLCPTTGNNFNAMAGAQVVPSLANVFYTYLDPELDTAGLSVQPPSPTASAGAGGAEPPRLDHLALSRLRQVVDDTRDDQAVGPAELLDDDTAYLALRRFSADVDRRIHDELRRLDGTPLRGLILDLRGNPGGDAAAALGLADDFLPKGEPLAERVEPDGDVEVLYARRTRCCQLPLVVLVDAGTASAAELLAGCLQHHRRAVLAGEPTYGKATAQCVARLPNGEPALAEAATFRLPDGGELHGAPLQPDLPVRAARADEAADAALKAAQHALRPPERCTAAR